MVWYGYFLESPIVDIGRNEEKWAVAK